MKYSEAIDYLYNRLPMFTRIGPAAYKASLDNIISLSAYFGNPHTKFKSIHIAGTNGKGSTSNMLAAILQTAGYKTGLYTSPHLKDFRERIRVNGQMIPERAVIDFVNGNQDYFSSIQPSFFEITTALAYLYFANEKVDIAVMETGLGGRLDSTNIIQPELSIITNISWDHKDLLGDTLVKIAGEKAGIIKSSVPVIISETQDEVKQVFVDKAAELHSPLFFADEEYKIISQGISLFKQELEYQTKHGNIKIRTDLPGIYQAKNVTGVLKACEILNDKGFHLTRENIIKGLKNVREITGLRGRWEILSEHPLIIADVGHNKAGLSYNLQQIDRYKHGQIHFVIGFVKDKDIDTILKLFPADAKYYFCKPDIPRGLDAALLAGKAAAFKLEGKVYSSVKNAFDEAKQKADNSDIIYIGGSTFVAGEVI